jgi:hypothetical protein
MVNDIANLWEQRLWDVANAIVAFALAQSLVAAYSIGKKELQTSFSDPRTLRVCIGLLLFVTAVQIVAVCACHWLTGHLALDQISSALWMRFTIGRSIAIAFFSIAPLTGFLLMLRKLPIPR